jgi:hypothetical protein
VKFWTWLRSNPYFVTATSALFGAFLNGLYQEVQAHSINWSLQGWESLGATAFGAVVIALYHLYTNTPAAAKGKRTAQKFGALVCIVLVLLASLPVMATAGCSSNELVADANTLAAALTSLAGAIQGTDPSIAAELKTVAAGLTAAANGVGVGPAWEQALNAAAAAADVVMSAIPVTAPFAMLLSIAVAAAELIISNTKAGDTVKAHATPNPSNQLWYLRHGQPLVKHRFGRSQSGDVKAAWNAVAIQTGYATVVLK